MELFSIVAGRTGAWEPTITAMDLSDDQLEEQCFVYKHEQLFSASFPLFKEIRRLGKLCDVTLKVSSHIFAVLRVIFGIVIV